MNNILNNKMKIIIALAAIGLILLCVGAVMGGSLSSIPTMFSEADLPEGVQSIDEVKTTDIRSVELYLVKSDITIKTGKSFSLSGTGLYDSYVKDGIFYAGAGDNKHSANIWGMKLKVPSKWVCGYGSYVLTIPKKANLDSITVHTSYCNISGDLLQAKTIDISMKSGDLNLAGITADTLTLSASRGKIDIQNAQITQTGTITAFRDIFIGNENTMKNFLGNVCVSTSLGDISLFGTLANESSLATGFGDINTTLTGSKDRYNLNSQRGNLTIGSETGTKISKENLDKLALTEGLYGDITFTCNHGKSTVHFK